MEAIIRLATDADKDRVIQILNYYIENSMAAYPQTPLPVQVWDGLRSLCRDGNLWVAELPEQGVVGFAMLKWYMTKDSFAETAETGYFILPGNTGYGIGSRLLDTLETAAKQLGVRVLLVNISSQNPESLAFHIKRGFTECGRLPEVGRKQNTLFDVVWVSKQI